MGQEALKLKQCYQVMKRVNIVMTGLSACEASGMETKTPESIISARCEMLQSIQVLEVQGFPRAISCLINFKRNLAWMLNWALNLYLIEP